MPQQPLLSVQNLTIRFRTGEGLGKAVDNVSFDLYPNETLGIVGESGCGKTVTALAILRLIQSPPGEISSGAIMFDGADLLTLPEKDLRAIRGNRIAMVFQEPMTALNPVFTIGDQIGEVFRIHQNASKAEARAKAIGMLRQVGIPDPEKRVDDYPHQLSGGMRQRAMIAMALGCKPAILIADEPTTALDVTIQAQILDLMDELKRKFGASIILITHDLGVVAQHAQRIAVMYAGKIVETCSVAQIFSDPKHPYTIGLMESIPAIQDEGDKPVRLREIKGIVPPLHAMPPGCPFHPRCVKRFEPCDKETPQLLEVAAGHLCACHLHIGCVTPA
ncbi:MAG: ABC transporter ATP-binding protein [Nitrospinae bacterium]|nr:ABC transporter ATP-binding protein [Nitrospinota bacterium]